MIVMEGTIRHWRRRNRGRRKPYHTMMILGIKRRKRIPVPLSGALETRYRVFMAERKNLHYKFTYADDDNKDYAWRMA